MPRLRLGLFEHAVVETCCHGPLQEAASTPPSAPGTIQAGGWADVFELQPATPESVAGSRTASSKRARLVAPSKQGASQVAAAHGRGQGAAHHNWLAQAELVVQRFDQQLTKVVEAALDACTTSQHSGSAPTPSDTGDIAMAAEQQRIKRVGEAAASRALVLEPFVQDRYALLLCLVLAFMCTFHPTFVVRCLLLAAFVSHNSIWQ